VAPATGPCRDGEVVELAAPPALERVEPADDRALRDWFALLTAAQAHDAPEDPAVPGGAQRPAGDG
jgi:CHAD domain-containing protein